MTKSEAQKEIKMLRKGKGISAKLGSYKLERINGPEGEWGIRFTPKGKGKRPLVYRG